MPIRIDDWHLEGLNAWNLKGKALVIGSCIFRALLWLLSKERNACSFEYKSLHFDSFCNFIYKTRALGELLYTKSCFVIIVCW